MNLLASSSSFFATSRHLLVMHTSVRSTGKTWAKMRMKHYVFLELEAKDCQQKFIRGWGPGGSKVNTSVNAVQLRHIPTNCIVKVHECRFADDNVRIARLRLKFAVDRHLNGENCYEEQLKRLEKDYSIKSNRKFEKRRELKKSLASPESKDEAENPDNVP
uniref:Prokaryotic-type class I peptide chain release factors domain-containing protein n=1 Tax=Ditylenchus dipsaci TaxID=166011 RepID=A0A915D4Y1_9BILA